MFVPFRETGLTPSQRSVAAPVFEWDMYVHTHLCATGSCPCVHRERPELDGLFLSPADHLIFETVPASPGVQLTTLSRPPPPSVRIGHLSLAAPRVHMASEGGTHSQTCTVSASPTVPSQPLRLKARERPATSGKLLELKGHNSSKSVRPAAATFLLGTSR